MLPKIFDKTGKLKGNQKEKLLKFLLEDCRTTTRDVEWLKAIIIRDDGPTDYFGYWQCRVKRSMGRVLKFEAVIILNSYYLRTIKALEKTLSHEYGHHWTLSHLVRRDHFEDEHNIFTERAPWAYYRMRRLDPSQVIAGVNNWLHCDKEIMAEDYRLFFTPYKEQHRMAGLYGKPSTEVKDYISSLGYRRPV